MSVLRSGLDLGLDSGGLVAGSVLARMVLHLARCQYAGDFSNYMFMYVGLFVHSAVVFHVSMFFMFLMRYVGLLIARLCFMSDTVLFIH